MRFELIPGDPDGHGDEDLLERAGRTGPVARIWSSGPGLVVPRTYAQATRFEAVRAAFARDGWPITVRLSGGGVVPQAPGILNFSLAFQARGRPMDHSEAAYRLICDIVQAALVPFGIETRPQAVAGSFCDGRFNLAVPEPARKVVGTAQVWRHIPGAPSDAQVGLVHALILARIDADLLTEQANRLEQALDSPRRYLSDRIASLDRLCRTPGSGNFEDRLRTALIAVLAQPWALRRPEAAPPPV